MINIGKILKRSWQILWDYKILWVFGILLAMTAGGGGGGNSGSGYQFNGDRGANGNNPQYDFGPAGRQLGSWFNQNAVPLFEHPETHIGTWIWIGVGLFLLILLIAAICALIRYPAETAVMRMVDDYEKTGTKLRFRQGWKLGWNRRAFRLWVIDFILGLPVFLFMGLLLGLGLLIYFSISRGSTGLAVAGTVAAIGGAFVVILAFIALFVVLGLLRHFFARSATLEGTGIGDSFRLGWGLFKRNWKSVALMWLVMIGIGIGYGIASLIVFFLLIPVYLVLLLPAVLVAVVPAGIAFGITSIFTSGPLVWIIAALVAIPFFFTILFAPLALVSSWYKIYSSNVWTLTYRELKAVEAVNPPAAPVAEAK
jgi:hypothetical protein